MALGIEVDQHLDLRECLSQGAFDPFDHVMRVRDGHVARHLHVELGEVVAARTAGTEVVDAAQAVLPGGDDVAAATLEAVAAGPGSVAWARAQGWSGETGLDLAASYRAGDEVAIAAVRRSAAAVGQAIAAAATLCDLEAVAIAGGFSHVADDYIDLVRAAAAAASLHTYARRCRVVPSGLDGDGPLLGAAALALRA